MAKYVTRRKFLWISSLAAAGLASGCVSLSNKDDVTSPTKKPVLEHVLGIPSYSKDIVGRDLGEKVNQVAADYHLEGGRNLSVYESLRRMYGISEDLGKVMDRTIYPDARDGVSEKERASVQMMYEVLKGLDVPSDLFVNPSYGKDNLKPEHYAVLDLVNSGKHGISVGLREARLMLEKGDWSKDYFVKALKGYKPKDDYKGVLDFLKATNWRKIYSDDWKKWRKGSREELVKYKKNLDILIQFNQTLRIRPVPELIDKVRKPEETRKDKKGDCEDLSIEAAQDMEFLDNIYQKVKVLNVWWGKGCKDKYEHIIKDVGHTVLSYKKKGERGIYVMDNTHKKHRFRGIRRFNSNREAGKKIAKENGISKKYGCKIKGLWAYPWEKFLYEFNNLGGFLFRESLI